MNPALSESEIATREAGPVSVMMPLERYEELLEGVDDLGEEVWLKRARRTAHRYRPPEEYIVERNS